jgi:hypothetical protein
VSQAVFVAAEDPVCHPRIEIEQSSATPADFRDFSG